jgi:hypothetical protein
MENIVVLRVASSGLGNLLFQLNCAEKVARRTGAKVKLDLQGLVGDELHSDKTGAGEKVLDMAKLYGFQVEQATIRDIWVTRGGWQGRYKLTRLLAKIQMKLGCLRRSYFKEDNSERFDPEVDSLSAPIYLDGYFISSRYLGEDIGRQSCTSNLFKYTDLINEINNTNSISIHIRRGDYCQLDDYPVYGMDYVRAASKLVEEKTGAGKYFVFTNDIDWARRECKLLEREVVLVSEMTGPAWEDLELMSLCKHNIISNSTFSWWAGYRNRNPNRVVVMPKYWHKAFDENFAENLELIGAVKI